MPSGNLVSATFDDVDVRTEQRIDVLSTTFQQNTLAFEHDFSDRLRVNALIGSSEAIGENPQQTTISLERFDVDGYSYDYSNPGLPAFNYNFDVANPANYVFSASTTLGDASLIRLRPNETENTYKTARLDFTWAASDIVDFSFGGSIKEFGFDVTEFRRTNEGVPATVLTEFAARGIAPSAYTKLLTDFGKGMSLPAGTATTWVIPDLNALRAITSFDCDCINAFGDFRLARFDGETRGATETSTGYYFQLDWNTQFQGMGFRGNAGLRQVTTELEATGILNGTPTTVTNTYSDTLPSLNMVLEPVDGLLFRFAAARTIARPNLASLTPGGSIDSVQPGLSLTAGNPALEPIRSNNLDFSVEWYPYQEALFAVAFFSKDIESFVQRLRRTIPYAETGFPDSLLGPGVTSLDLFDVTSFTNTNGGKLTGYEITIQTPFTFLPESLEGFGMLLNYTSIESDFEYITNPTSLATVRQPLVGQSPESISGTLYFERGPIEARISATHRGEYLTTVPAQSGNDVEGKAATTNIDFSASWDVNERLEISFEGLNLTDEYDDRWINSVRKNNLNYEHTGREFVVGVRYKF
jgi:iron complex outermembrane recepter protein